MPPNLLNYLPFISKPCLLSCIWRNCFSSHSRPGSPFVLQIPALSTLVYYHFPLMTRVPFCRSFLQQNVLMCFLTLSWNPLIFIPLQQLTPFYNCLFKFLERILHITFFPQSILLVLKYSSFALQHISWFSSYFIDGSFLVSFINSPSALSLNFGIPQVFFWPMVFFISTYF